jgi:hypothetical protein
MLGDMKADSADACVVSRTFLRDHELEAADDTAFGQPERALAQAKLKVRFLASRCRRRR